MTIAIADKEKSILRSLAVRVRDHASNAQQVERKKRLSDLNSLKADRPVVLSFPEGAWSELIPESSLECENILLRAWELQLRKTLYQCKEIKDDSAVSDTLDIEWVFLSGDFGKNIIMSHGADKGSYTWQPVLTNIAQDLPHLKFRIPTVDKSKTYQNLEMAQELLGDILTPRIRGNLWWTVGLTSTAISLVGLENFMILPFMDPEGMHQLMAWLRDEQIHFITWCENNEILTPNNGLDCIGSGAFGLTSELPVKHLEKTFIHDLWGLSESQESVGMSPEVFGEFIFPYQLPIIQKFGLSCYGCCEGIHDRLEYILKIPNLRRISVSPWADQEIIADKINGKYVFSRKPNPSEICMSFNEDSIRSDIRKTLAIAGKGALEIILKDTHTVNNEPWRINKWVEIALCEVDSFMSKK